MKNYIVEINLPITLHIDNVEEKAEAIIQAKKMIKGFENMEVSKGFCNRFKTGIAKNYRTEEHHLPF